LAGGSTNSSWALRHRLLQSIRIRRLEAGKRNRFIQSMLVKSRDRDKNIGKKDAMAGCKP